MQKVGMSRREVKRSIRAQVLMVFFLPLVTSFVHLAFSFNMISRMISIVGFTNVPLFVCCTAATALRIRNTLCRRVCADRKDLL